MGSMSREAVKKILTVEDVKAILGDEDASFDVEYILEARKGPDTDTDIKEIITSLCEILYDNVHPDCDIQRNFWDTTRDKAKAIEGPISLSALKSVRKDSLFANAILKILREHDYHDDNDETPISPSF
jgi:hypothetical protein